SSASKKHEPTTIISCSTEHKLSEGEAETTTGALMPRSIWQTCVCVNGPNELSSPPVTVRLKIMLATPPQQASGKAVPGSCGESAGIVACNNSLFTMVIFLSGMISSGTPSAFPSQTISIFVGVN